MEIINDSADDSLPDIDNDLYDDDVENISDDISSVRNESFSDNRDNLSSDLKREINRNIENQHRNSLIPTDISLLFAKNEDENKQFSQSSSSSIDENHLYIYEDVVVYNPTTNSDQVKSLSDNIAIMDNPPFEIENNTEEKEKSTQASGDEITSKLPEKAYQIMASSVKIDSELSDDTKQFSKNSDSANKSCAISYNDIPSAKRIISALINHAGVFISNFNAEFKYLDFLRETRYNSREILKKQAGDFLFSIKKSSLKSYEKNKADLIDYQNLELGSNSRWPFQDSYDHVVDYMSISGFNKTLEMHSKWSKEEINRLKQLFPSHHKDFITLSDKIGTKTVDNVIEFYYKFREHFVKPKTKQSGIKSENGRDQEINKDLAVILFLCLKFLQIQLISYKLKT